MQTIGKKKQREEHNTRTLKRSLGEVVKNIFLT